jgi:hypothetical protein
MVADTLIISDPELLMTTDLPESVDRDEQFLGRRG